METTTIIITNITNTTLYYPTYSTEYLIWYSYIAYKLMRLVLHSYEILRQNINYLDEMAEFLINSGIFDPSILGMQ